MQITLGQLLLAYRQAKQALFQEQRTPDRLALAEAEVELPRHMAQLQSNLMEGRWFDGITAGALWLPIKKAHRTESRETGVVVIDGPPTKPPRRLDLRVHFTPSLQFSTLEAVWLWQFGPAVEAVLSDAARGNRLNLRTGGTELDLHDRDSFRFWPEAYRQFRDHGLATAKGMLQNENGGCTIATFDIASFYDDIDDKFLLDNRFLDQVQTCAAAKSIAFDADEYTRATKSLLAAFGRYRAQRTRLLGVRAPRGIPIGALTSRVVGNLALGTC